MLLQRTLLRLTTQLQARLPAVLRARVARWVGKPPLSPEQRAKDLLAAIDAGGLPLNPARVNYIARQLGLEVSTRAPMPETIERIRQALGRK